MTDASGLGWMPYIPKLLYRDLAPVADPYHADDLRRRDLEIFVAHGTFCRRPIPNEFPRDAPLDDDTYVIVTFTGDVYRKRLGERDGVRRPATMIRPRRGATGRRRS